MAYPTTTRERAVELHADGLSLDAIAAHLTRETGATVLAATVRDWHARDLPGPWARVALDVLARRHLARLSLLDAAIRDAAFETGPDGELRVRADLSAEGAAAAASAIRAIAEAQRAALGGGERRIGTQAGPVALGVRTDTCGPEASV